MWELLTLVTQRKIPLFQDLNSQDQDEDPMNKLKGQKIVSCRICKGDHWTTRCPYKDTLGPMQKELAEQLGLSTGDKEKSTGGGKTTAFQKERKYSERVLISDSTFRGHFGPTQISAGVSYDPPL